MHSTTASTSGRSSIAAASAGSARRLVAAPLAPLPRPRRRWPRGADAATAATASPADPGKNNPRAGWSYESPVQRVRDYELDIFSVVNNGVYAHLFQDARHLALEKMTGTSVCAFLEQGVLMALSELVIRYKSPLRSGDAYVCRVGVAEVRGTRVTLSQQVAAVDAATGEERAVAAEGSATVVFLDSNYRPARMPADARRAFEEAAAAASGGGKG